MWTKFEKWQFLLRPLQRILALWTKRIEKWKRHDDQQCDAIILHQEEQRESRPEELNDTHATPAFMVDTGSH